MGAGGSSGLILQVLVDIQLADAHARIDFALAQALQRQLVAQLLAKALRADAVGRQALEHGRMRDAVLLRHGLLSLRDRQGVHLDTHLARGLELRLFQNGALQYLAHQGFARRRSAALLRHLRLDARDTHAHLVVGDGLGIDDSDDVIGLADSAGAVAGRHGGRQGGGCCRGRRQSTRSGRLAGSRWAQTLGRGALGRKRSQASKGQGESRVFHGVNRSC